MPLTMAHQDVYWFHYLSVVMTNVIRDLPNINDREDEEHVEKKHLLIFWVFALFVCSPLLMSC